MYNYSEISNKKLEAIAMVANLTPLTRKRYIGVILLGSYPDGHSSAVPKSIGAPWHAPQKPTIQNETVDRAATTQIQIRSFQSAGL